MKNMLYVCIIILCMFSQVACKGEARDDTYEFHRVECQEEYPKDVSRLNREEMNRFLNAPSRYLTPSLPERYQNESVVEITGPDVLQKIVSQWQEESHNTDSPKNEHGSPFKLPVHAVIDIRLESGVSVAQDHFRKLRDKVSTVELRFHDSAAPASFVEQLEFSASAGYPTRLIFSGHGSSPVELNKLQLVAKADVIQVENLSWTGGAGANLIVTVDELFFARRISMNFSVRRFGDCDSVNIHNSRVTGIYDDPLINIIAFSGKAEKASIWVENSYFSHNGSSRKLFWASPEFDRVVLSNIGINSGGDVGDLDVKGSVVIENVEYLPEKKEY